MDVFDVCLEFVDVFENIGLVESRVGLPRVDEALVSEVCGSLSCERLVLAEVEFWNSSEIEEWVDVAPHS